jgi:hypothetical protein
MDEQKVMQDLIIELRKALARITNQPPMVVHVDDDATPRATIATLAELINQIGDDAQLRSLVGSVFETKSPHEVYVELRRWNEVNSQRP